MMGANVSFCVMSGLIRHASGIDAYKTTLFRFVIGMALLGVAALAGKIKLRFVNSPLLFLRGLIGGLAVFLFFLSIAKLGVAKGTVLNYVYPIIASILGVFFLKERLCWRKILAITGAFAGIYLLTVQRSPDSVGFTRPGIFEILALLGAVFSGIAIVIVKKLHDTDTTYAIFFSQCVMGTWLLVLPANLIPCEIGYSGGLLLVLIGLAAASAQMMMTEGYRYLTVTTGSLLNLLLPVLNFGLGVLVFGEHVSLRSVVGSAIVLSCCAAVVAFEE